MTITKKINKKKLFLKTRTGTFLVYIWYDIQDKAYIVEVPSLPDVCTFGSSLAHARRMAKEAIELSCDCTVAEGRAIVDDLGKFIGKIPKSRVLTLVR